MEAFSNGFMTAIGAGVGAITVGLVVVTSDALASMLFEKGPALGHRVRQLGRYLVTLRFARGGRAA